MSVVYAALIIFFCGGIYLMKKKTISIDIDGTIRDLIFQIEKYIEIDHYDKYHAFLETKNIKFNSLDKIFGSKEKVYEWMYEQRVFELFGMAPRLHPKIIDELNMFTLAAEQQGYDVWISSVQFDRSIPATLFWLSKNGCKVPNIKFFRTMKEKARHKFDIYLDDCPEILKSNKKSSIKIKVPYKYNEDFDLPSLDIENGDFNHIYDILKIERM